MTTPTQDYDEDNDILYINWGRVKESVELFNGNIVLDFGDGLDVVGIEIFGYVKEIGKSQKRLDRMLSNKKNKHNQSRIQTFKKTGCYT